MAKPSFTIQLEPNPSAQASSARFLIEPLPQGFGHTLGNALRRVLYSSIPGAAVTSVTISGAAHQFSSVEGVQEDVVQLILALKRVRFSYSGTDSLTISLSAKGPGPVTASQFDLPANLRIANPDEVIAHLADKNTKLDLTVTVESGFGYSPAEDRKSTTIGVIPVDAIFTPIVRVNYSVEATRVGRVTNFDRLVIDLSTDGTISPQSALTSAAQVLVDYFSVIVHPELSENSSAPSVSATAGVAAPSSGPSISIEELDLPTRISNALQKAGFDSVNDLLTVPKAELAKVKNLGSKSVKIIETALKQRGFELTA